MQLKKLAIAVTGALLIAGCNGTTEIKPDKDPSAEVNKPKPVSTVFNRPKGPTQIEFGMDGQFVSITATGTAPIAGNNAYSIEQAVTAATLRAKRNLSEFLTEEMNTQRTINVISHTVQKSKENTLNGMIDTPIVINDDLFDINGNLAMEDAINDPYGTDVQAPEITGYPGAPNSNEQKVAETVKENIVAQTKNILRGVYVIEEKVNPEGRTVNVTIGASSNSINAANELKAALTGE
jgi:hypothetical protein